VRKNVGSQVVAFQMVSATDGSDVTAGTPTVYYTIDGGAQGTGGGTAAHEGNGQWTYVPLQAETNGNHVVFTMTISGAISQCVNIYPVSYDPTDAVRIGLTALPNAAADAAGGLPISDAGGLDLDALNTNISAILDDTGTSGVVLSAGAVDAIWDEMIAGVHTSAGTAGYYLITILSDVGSVATAVALTASQASVNVIDGIVDAILVDTNELQTDWVDGGRLDLLLDATLADTNELQTDWVDGGRLDLLLDAILDDTGTSGVVVQSILDGSIGADAVADIFSTTTIAEAYAADGAAATPAQILYLVMQTIGEFSISSTTLTAKKLDGTTTAATYTLDDATSPTSRTRAT